jgi:hypothetical protein
MNRHRPVPGTATLAGPSTGRLARRSIYLSGIIWSIAIWTIPEGFGGSFLSGATDIGTGIMYALLFAVLYTLETLPTATGAWSLDRRIERIAPWWRILAEPGDNSPRPSSFFDPGIGHGVQSKRSLRS